MTPDELEERIRDAMTGDETAPRSALWGRIAERRDEGDRVVLPLEVQRRFSPMLVISGIAAAMLVVMPFLERSKPDQLIVGPVVHRAPKESESVLFPGALMAQASATPAFASPPMLRGADHHPGKWTHGRFEKGELRETYTYELRRSTYLDAPAWLVLSTAMRLGRGWDMIDTTWASVDSMQPLMRIAHSGDARIEQTYRKEDILTGVTRNGFTSWTTIPQRDPSVPYGGGVLFRPSEIAIRLMAMDLDLGWRGSIPLPTVGEQGIAPLWLNLVVDGSETMNVPAGTFEAWRIRLLFGKKPLEPYDPARPPSGLYFWVSKDKHWLVQMSIVNSREPDDAPLVLMKGEQE